MSAERKHSRLAIFLVALWVVFTVTLTGWWLIFGLRQLDLINQSNLENALQLHRHYQMLLWEGGILIASLIGGGLALFYFARREQKRHAQVEEFFAAFTHDAKTALASLRLQAESLQEDFAEAPNPLLDRLLGDTLRLQLQLENSLFLVNLTRGKFFVEPISLSSCLENLSRHWPDLTIRQSGDAVVTADARALESVLTNLIQNAVTHGHATEIEVKVTGGRKGRTAVVIADNGRGFSGDLNQLGKLFVRHGRGSGSGVGLYIARQLIKRMNGNIEFDRGAEAGFVARFDLPAAGDTPASGVLIAATEKVHAGGVVSNHEASLAGRR
ncbi:MAG TPA: HAMP domain-containing sensor histidine kinase [Pyrinomonadaceae bacterium]|nr:HAMP domain-containing sensor histidine kinase [Pyrinomonadaceae bacterium]